MRKLVLLLLLGWLGVSPPPAQAQTAATAADTLQAVRRLYSQHRTGGAIWGAIGGLFTLRILTASASESFGNASGTVVGVALLGGVPGAIGIGKLSRFSQAQESRVTAEFQRSHRLPLSIQRRLRRKHFAP